MRVPTKEGLSRAVISLALGLGGSFLAAAFILEALLHGGFMVPGAASIFVLVAIAVYLFGSVRPHIFSLATLAWLILLLALAPF